MKVQKYDIVKCPFDEIGIVQEYEEKYPWGNQAKVLIIKTNGIMHELGDIVEYKPEDLKVVKELHF